MNSDQIPFESQDFQRQISSDQANDYNYDSYVNVVLTSKQGFNLNTGIRLNHHSHYKTHFVYSINPFYRLNFKNQYLKFMASYGTAFISPSLYQLFAPNFGNSNLDPQQDATLEMSIEFGEANQLEWVTTLYKRFQTNYIDYVISNPATYTGNYQNVSGDTSVQGVETRFKYFGTQHLSFEFNYAFTESKSRQLFRIPKHKINANADYEFLKSFKATIGYQYSGKRTSTQQLDSEPITLKSYGLFNVGLSCDIVKNGVIFAKITNVFNEPFEEFFRYSTLGRNYVFGANFKF